MTHNNVCHRLFFCDSRRTIIFSYRGRICITDPKKRVFAEIDSGKESKFFAEGYRWSDVKVFNERYSNDNRLKLNDLPSLNYSRNMISVVLSCTSRHSVWSAVECCLGQQVNFIDAKVAALRERKYIEIFTWLWITDCRLTCFLK